MDATATAATAAEAGTKATDATAKNLMAKVTHDDDQGGGHAIERSPATRGNVTVSVLPDMREAAR